MKPEKQRVTVDAQVAAKFTEVSPAVHWLSCGQWW
jgi:hypothetical protein